MTFWRRRRKVADNTVPYGTEVTKRFRTPLRAGEFNGTGTKPEAIVLDIDGTLETWGATIKADTLEWIAKHVKAGRVLIVITARTHDYDYQRSFNWLVAHLPHPFIGPFCRVKDDARYASEFKREVAEALSQLFTIVGAAEDNHHVNAMWRHWAALHPEVEFDLLECGYGDYSDWRKTLPAARSYGGGWSAYDRWEDYKHRPAGTSRYDDDLFSDLDVSPVHVRSKDERMALEDELYAADHDLSWHQIEVMDVEEIRTRLAQAHEADTGPLDVAEIFDKITDEKPEVA